jgi:hypothetical protein
MKRKAFITLPQLSSPSLLKGQGEGQEGEEGQEVRIKSNSTRSQAIVIAIVKSCYWMESLSCLCNALTSLSGAMERATLSSYNPLLTETSSL